MGSISADVPALKNRPQYIFFTDFDGTVTVQDSNDWLSDNFGYGKEKRLEGGEAVLYGRMPFRDLLQGMLDSVSMPFDQCADLLLKNIQLDPGFQEFHAWAKTNNIPIVILSGGMEPIIRALLGHLLGEKEAQDIQIVSNNVMPRPGKQINQEGGWQLVFRDDSGFGHDKSVEIRKYSQLAESERPHLFYAGDGVSDLSAAKETDLMFAKSGKDLVTYCEKENVPFTAFNDWSDISSVVKNVVSGKISIKDAATGRI